VKSPTSAARQGDGDRGTSAGRKPASAEFGRRSGGQSADSPGTDEVTRRNMPAVPQTLFSRMGTKFLAGTSPQPVMIAYLRSSAGCPGTICLAANGRQAC